MVSCLVRVGRLDPSAHGPGRRRRRSMASTPGPVDRWPLVDSVGSGMALGCLVTRFSAAFFVCRVILHTCGKRKGEKQGGERGNKRGRSERRWTGSGWGMFSLNLPSLQPLFAVIFPFVPVLLRWPAEGPKCIVDNDRHALQPLCCRLSTVNRDLKVTSSQ